MIRKNGKPLPPEYESLSVPSCYIHIWEWFLELNRCRSSNGFGLNSISFLEIDAWSRLTGNKPKPFELRAIQELDVTFLTLQNKKTKSEQKK